MQQQQQQKSAMKNIFFWNKNHHSWLFVIGHWFVIRCVYYNICQTETWESSDSISVQHMCTIIFFTNECDVLKNLIHNGRWLCVMMMFVMMLIVMTMKCLILCNWYVNRIFSVYKTFVFVVVVVIFIYLKCYWIDANQFHWIKCNNRNC